MMFTLHLCASVPRSSVRHHGNMNPFAKLLYDWDSKSPVDIITRRAKKRIIPRKYIKHVSYDYAAFRYAMDNILNRIVPPNPTISCGRRTPRKKTKITTTKQIEKETIRNKRMLFAQWKAEEIMGESGISTPKALPRRKTAVKSVNQFRDTLKIIWVRFLSSKRLKIHLTLNDGTETWYFINGMHSTIANEGWDTPVEHPDIEG